MFIKLCNVGQDAITRFTPQGMAVTNVSCAYSVGYKGNTQWIDAAFWGGRGQKMAQYLRKGTKILLKADDIEVVITPNGAPKLQCRIVDIELLGSPQPQQQSYSQPEQAQGNYHYSAQQCSEPVYGESQSQNSDSKPQ